MQKLSEEDLSSATSMQDETIPALEGTDFYFALVVHNNKRVLCILDDGKWRVTNYQEMMGLM